MVEQNGILDSNDFIANKDEENYLNQIREILAKGTVRTDRTGTGTLSIFGMQARYNLRGGSKEKVLLKTIFEKQV